MFNRRNGKSSPQDAQQSDRFLEQSERSGKEIASRLAGLRTVPREGLVDAVFMLSMAAKRQSQLMWRSIKERAKAEPGFDPPLDADVATYLAAETASTLRDNTVDAPKVLDLVFERSPKIRFTLFDQEAVSVLAAMIRQQRIEGILEGLRLAGLLNQPSKDRHAGAVMDEELGRAVQQGPLATEAARKTQRRE
jgi:hypothetical protein